MSTESSTPLEQLLQDEWETRLQEDPLFATYTGDRRYNDRLPGASEEDYARRLEQLRAFQRRLQALMPEALRPAERLNARIFAEYLANEIGELQHHAYRLPICKTGGFHTDFAELPSLFIPLNDRTDYENWLARLQAFPRLTRELIGVMRTGLDTGYTPARPALEGVAEQVQAFLGDDPRQSRYYQPFTRFPPALSGADQERLQRQAQQVIQQAIVPAYQDLLKFIVDEYLPGSREAVGASALPDGEAFYQHRIRAMTSLDLPPEEIHQIGLQEVERIQAEMQTVIAQSDFPGDKSSFAAFLDYLRRDPRFYAPTAEALLKETAYILKRMDGELPRLFGRLPRLPYGIRPVPEASAPYTTTAYYYPPPGDGSRAGVYYVNTYDLPSRPLYEIEALSLHEAVPGHHLQIALALELQDLPLFRRYASFTAYVEGWALYAERLGLEVGFYTDPYSNFGRLSYEMWRACRLVVDTGLHALGWTRQQAVDFMAAHTSSTLPNIANEVDRYIAWPGQALAYKLGELKIRSLRRQAEAALGPRFDLRRFHDVLLGSGAVPLNVLEELVQQWLAAAGDIPA